MLEEKRYTVASKLDTYQIFAELCKNLEETEQIIELTITKITSLIEDCLYNISTNRKVLNHYRQIRYFFSWYGHSNSSPRTGMRFSKKTTIERRNNVIGSTIIGKMEIDISIPIACVIHAHRCFTTNKKIKLLRQYEGKYSIFQDGTDNILKHGKSAVENFKEHEKRSVKALKNSSLKYVESANNHR